MSCNVDVFLSGLETVSQLGERPHWIGRNVYADVNKVAKFKLFLWCLLSPDQKQLAITGRERKIYYGIEAVALRPHTPKIYFINSFIRRIDL